jgi:hypothetical protein
MWQKMPDLMLAKCFDEETEVLTSEGFEKFSEVKGKVMMVTPDGLLKTEATPWSQDYSGPMVTLESDDLNFSVTPNHTMVTDIGRMDASVLFDITKSRSKAAIPRSVSNTRQDNKNITDQQLVLTAGLLTDGYQSSGRSFLIKVSKQRKVEMLKAVGGYENINIEPKIGYIAKSHTREIVTKRDFTSFRYPMELCRWLCDDKENINFNAILSLSRRQAKIFVDSMIKFDGHENKKTGVRRYYSSRTSYIKLVEFAAIQAGYSVSSVKSRLSDISKNPNFYITISERDLIPVRKYNLVEKEKGLTLTKNDSGKVWCVSVPSQTIVVRRKGFSMICGNCAEMLALRKAFPAELSGLYSSEEMDQSKEHEVEAVKVNQPRLTQAQETYKKHLEDLGNQKTGKGILFSDAFTKDRVKAIKHCFDIEMRMEKEDAKVEQWEIDFLSYGKEMGFLDVTK